VRLVGAESSKIVHQFNTGDQVSGVTCVGWAANFTRKTSSSARSPKPPESWEAFLAEGRMLSDDATSLDLPRDLSLIDIETSLPKLSVLAAGGSS
jgi:anaphase-promoting complex subunit 4